MSIPIFPETKVALKGKKGLDVAPRPKGQWPLRQYRHSERQLKSCGKAAHSTIAEAAHSKCLPLKIVKCAS